MFAGVEEHFKRCSIVFYIHFVLQSFNVVFNLYACFSSSLQKVSFVSFRQSRIMVTPIIFVYSELEVFATQIQQVIAQQTIAAKMEFASQIKFVGTLQVIILIYIPISVFNIFCFLKDLLFLHQCIYNIITERTYKIIFFF
jgi:hypothetical protein